ncbi:MAG: lysophospholipid acyltransferase family protein [Chloroflexota bacterium]
MAGLRDPNEGSWAASAGRPAADGAPVVRATAAFRILLGGCRLIAAALGIRIRVEGTEHLPRTADGRPAGGWIAAGLPHRTWIDPFVVTLALPLQPRVSWFGDGRAMFRSRWRRWAFALVGGVVPIWPGGRRQAVDAHFDAAGRILAADGVFALFPEVGPAVPVDRARPLGGGIGYIAVRSEAPLVPLVLGGAHELYLGRRILLRVLPATSWRDLAGEPPDAPTPQPGSPDERDVARRVTLGLHALTIEAVAAACRDAERMAGNRRVWKGLTRLFH